MNEAASRPPSSDTESLLLDLEAQRCDAMKRADFAGLRETAGGNWRFRARRWK
jgi:hypothetical protein